MKCPECHEDFRMTWSRYFRSPMGRMSCPFCGVRLAMKHRWFYWPAMVLSGTVLCVPFTLLGYHMTESIIVTMIAATVGWVLSGLPADRYLEARFAVLKPLGKTMTPPEAAPPGQEPPEEKETQEEQA